MRRYLSLKTIAQLWVFAAFGTGVLAAGLWVQSTAAWDAYRSRAHAAGVSTYLAVTHGATPDPGLSIVPLDADTHARLANRDYAGLIDAAPPVQVTNASILSPHPGALSSGAMQIVVLSPDLKYQLSDIVTREGQPPYAKLGNLTRLLATYCSEPIIILTVNGQHWRVDGRAVWGCGAVPRDLRLPAAVLAVVAMAALVSSIAFVTGGFGAFANALRRRQHLNGPQAYTANGPAELNDTVRAVNSYLEHERKRLSDRAAMLSGVSHDLGTPATRLRLRAAMISDGDLRARFEQDIDRLTGIIESVLTYTQSELSAEPPQRIALGSLVEALVDDYHDVGKPVRMAAPDPLVVSGARSVFGSRRGHSTIPTAPQPVLVMARPVSLQRAISNLIDNALKYGRRATVHVRTDAHTAMIVIDDEGTGQAEDMHHLTKPFQRGDNARTIDGFGLGLSIVATVAEHHGGSLSFENTGSGLRAILTLRRD